LMLWVINLSLLSSEIWVGYHPPFFL